MAKPSTFRLLNGVEPARNNWLIRVKVLHSWKQNTSFGGETFECVLADETGVKIATYCKRNQIFRLQRDLPVGEWKTIDTFQVLAASGHYHPTNHVIGQVVDLKGVQTVQAMGKDKKMVQFRLHDCSGDEIACCLWGKFAEQVETILEDYCNNERVIMLIRFAKIGFFRGEVQVTNAFDASIVDINPIYEEAIEFKENGDEIACCLWGKFAEQVETILEDCNNERVIMLIRFAKIGFFRGEVQVTNAFDASIVDINPIYEEAIEFKEKKEAKQIAQKKKEDWNEIEVRSISEILVAAEIEDPIILPQPIESLVGKSFCFGISISNDNVNNGSITFKVSEVWSGDKIQKIESQTEPSSCFDTNPSTLSGGDRKEEDADLLDMASTSKMKCTKMIKLEKTKTDE
ncbi:hypothetical protein F2Q68_00027928 [Brassica cretica]|uniref:Replication protein A 70 kDa DNA-binding subunit B/D first OB fold domain-containing protein n=1 Tax=Brassica cretica TaxID=69181 RepID=A0A8S9IJ19_BRACR|nr:hypothetical protein F2Q68_00027928 [Brassica cretica]